MGGWGIKNNSCLRASRPMIDQRKALTPKVPSKPPSYIKVWQGIIFANFNLWRKWQPLPVVVVEEEQGYGGPLNYGALLRGSDRLGYHLISGHFRFWTWISKVILKKNNNVLLIPESFYVAYK